jgi:hypothetical protein
MENEWTKEIDRLREEKRLLLEALKMALRYLEHPDVLAVTNLMAMPGALIVQRTRAAIAQAERPVK